MIVESIDNIVVKEPVVENGKKEVTNVERKFPNHTLSVYLEALALELKTSEKVVKNTVLQSETWTKSCYDLLSKIITEELTKTMTPENKMTLGTSLSSKTLQKIITLQYKVSYPIDPRTLNTLHKVVFFLGYEHWDGFIQKADETNADILKDLNPEEEVKRVVKEAVEKEHLVYCCLPEIREEYLTQSFINNSPSYNMIMDVLIEKADKKQIISNNYNPSTCEILDIEVKRLEDNYAQVYTREYRLLCWWDTLKKRYVKRYKDISDHFYILKKLEDRWIIKTNASTSDPMELG